MSLNLQHAIKPNIFKENERVTSSRLNNNFDTVYIKVNDIIDLINNEQIGDMSRSTYDPNHNGVVDTCSYIDWNRVIGIPDGGNQITSLPTDPPITSNDTSIATTSYVNNIVANSRDCGTWGSF